MKTPYQAYHDAGPRDSRGNSSCRRWKRVYKTAESDVATPPESPNVTVPNLLYEATQVFLNHRKGSIVKGVLPKSFAVVGRASRPRRLGRSERLFEVETPSATGGMPAPLFWQHALSRTSRLFSFRKFPQEKTIRGRQLPRRVPNVAQQLR
jgi:hypothetical protein